MPAPKKVEKRDIAVDDIEIKVEVREDGGADGEPYVEGLGIVYDREVEIFDGYFEKIRPGALSRSVNSDVEIKCFFNHSPNMVLSTTRSDPKLELSDTPQGLRFRSPIPPTSYGKDLKENLKRRNVRGASFAFAVDEGGDIVTRDEKGNYHREITSATLYEVGPVTNPAYRQTKVKLRDDSELFAEAEERCAPSTPAPEAKTGMSDIEIKRAKLNLIERCASSVCVI